MDSEIRKILDEPEGNTPRDHLELAVGAGGKVWIAGHEFPAPAAAVKCGTCGWDTERFRKTGRLGCPDCYLVFSEALAGVLGNMHRGYTHLGKVPQNHETNHQTEDVIEKVALRKKIADCQQELEMRIRNEEYEEAAVLRDRIIELKKELDGEDSHAG